MAITREDLAQMRLAAQMCDDYTQYKREMREIAQLEAELNRMEREARQNNQRAAA